MSRDARGVSLSCFTETKSNSPSVSGPECHAACSAQTTCAGIKGQKLRADAKRQWHGRRKQ